MTIETVSYVLILSFISTVFNGYIKRNDLFLIVSMFIFTVFFGILTLGGTR